MSRGVVCVLWGGGLILSVHDMGQLSCDWYRGGGNFCTGNFSHEKISRRVYFAQWPEN